MAFLVKFYTLNFVTTSFNVFSLHSVGYRSSQLSCFSLTFASHSPHFPYYAGLGGEVVLLLQVAKAPKVWGRMIKVVRKRVEVVVQRRRQTKVIMQSQKRDELRPAGRFHYCSTVKISHVSPLIFFFAPFSTTWSVHCDTNNQYRL